jgi:hypothetical protein
MIGGMIGETIDKSCLINHRSSTVQSAAAHARNTTTSSKNAVDIVSTEILCCLLFIVIRYVRRSLVYHSEVVYGLIDHCLLTLAQLYEYNRSID